jgi:hypothetical protein
MYVKERERDGKQNYIPMNFPRPLPSSPAAA